MPELPEVETVRRDLDQRLSGCAIQSVLVLRPQTVAYPDPEGFCVLHQGSQFSSWRRRGKYLLAEMKSGSLLVVHLRMTGQLLIVPRGEPWSKHTRVVFKLATEEQDLRFVDQRTFGQMWGIPAGLAVEKVIPTLGRLGPEPLTENFSLEYWQGALAKSRRPIKTALLDQTLVAGVGNIYADEALFLSGIHPQTPAQMLTSAQVAQLQEQLIEVLEAGIQARGTTFSDYRDPSGINGNYQGQAWVYGREGDPCRACGDPIVRLKMGGRSAHFCSRCQS